ncbi:MAG TPA: MATE family efflux transporter [Paucimonas sp.]|nr:MATE family efflux transporter [Paucimonas sp.]
MDAAESRHPVKRIAALAWPILIGQLAVIANGVLDTAMTSRYSATDLAALAVGSSIYVSVFVGGHGVLQALSPAISQLFGAKRYQAIGVEVKQGAWLAVFLSLLGALVLLFPQPFLSLAHASPELNAKATLYLQILAIALPATLGFRVFSGLNNALARPKIVMAIHVGALLLKIPLNALFIFGGLGLPAFGGPGAAIATAIVSWLTLLAGWLVLRTSPFYDKFSLFGGGFVLPDWKAQRALLRLGIPMGLSYLIEVTAFTFMAVFIARLGEIPVSGHQITANFGTLLYMLPLAIANATATLTAHAVGARRMQEAKRIGNSGILLAASLSIVIGCTVWFARGLIVRAYTPDPAIMAAALPLFMFIAFYQLLDAIQVTTAFVLRAYKIVVVPTLIYAFALWGVGLGGGYLIGLDPFGIMPPALRGASGFWIGNSTSLALVAIGLFWYLRVVQREVLPEGQEIMRPAAAQH